MLGYSNESDFPLSVTGMDAFMRECPDLAAFKKYLIKGCLESQADTNTEKELDLALRNAGFINDSLNDLSTDERIILLIAKRVLHDAGTEASLPTADRISMIVLDPGRDSQSGEPLVSAQKITQVFKSAANLREVISIEGSLEEGILQVQQLLESSECEAVLLCSFFYYSDPDTSHAAEISQNSAISESGLRKGAGAVLLTAKNQPASPARISYAHLEKVNPGADRQNHANSDSLDPFWPVNQPMVGNSFEVLGNKSGTALSATIEEIRTESINPFAFADESIHPKVEFARQGAEIVSLLRAALCVNSRVILPATESLQQESSPSDLPQTMQPWFPELYTRQRTALLSFPNYNAPSSLFALKKETDTRPHPENPFQAFGLHLLPISFNGEKDLLDKLTALKGQLSTCEHLPSFINITLRSFADRQKAAHTLVLLGHTPAEFLSEMEHARSSMPACLESGREWKTPLGSYFSPTPIGAGGKIAFVYPGAFNTYIGMGSEIFYLFPELQDHLQALTADPGGTINARILYPWITSTREKELLQMELYDDPIKMITSGVCFSFLYSVILREYFKVNPEIAFGYSLGENSMMFAMGVWCQGDAMRTTLEATPTFHTRVVGPQNAIREKWGLLPAENDGERSSVWANYVLMASPEQAQEAIKDEPHVYITHINAPRQIVIGGEKGACQRVIASLKCMHLQAPYNHAIHCDAISSEYSALIRMHHWPVENQPQTTILSAADYAPIQYDSRKIAEGFARMLSNPIDFPRLVELAYQDGARIFIELGAGSNCSKWIEATLKGRPHTAVSINQNDVDDHVSILRLVARLVSHGIPLDLSLLYREG